MYRRLPIVRSCGQNASTTANCNLFNTKDNRKVFLDFEGECGTEPSVSRYKNCILLDLELILPM